MILERPIVASVLGNGSAVIAVAANAANVVHQWATTLSVLMVVALNASLILISWRKERRDARDAAERCRREQERYEEERRVHVRNLRRLADEPEAAEGEL